VPEPLPRFFSRTLQRIEDERKLAKILLEVDAEEVADARSTPATRSASGHHRDRARGIPIVGRASAGGASPGTDPLGALLRKERRTERGSKGSKFEPAALDAA
jgi:hypothetical protein